MFTSLASYVCKVDDNERLNVIVLSVIRKIKTRKTFPWKVVNSSEKLCIVW